MVKIVKPLILFIAISLILQSCDKDRRTIKTENQEIQDFIISHPEYNFVEKESGLFYADVVVGEGIAPKPDDYVSVRYTVSLFDGTLVDTNAAINDEGDYLYPIWKFHLGSREMIQGFDEGVSYMKLGGEAIMIIPSALGYGNENDIYEPYTPFLVTVKLTRIQ